MAYASGSQLALLDVVEIRLREPKPHACQVENHLIDDEVRWRKIGALDPERLPELAEEPPDLWGTENHGYIRDRIPTAEADLLASSLLLVQLANPSVEVRTYPDGTKVRVDFDYRGVHYNMVATDPDFKARFASMGHGDYVLGTRTYACLSLGEPAPDGKRYKLAAAVFQLD